MTDLIYPKAVLFTRNGTYIVEPHHNLSVCKVDSQPRVDSECDGCRYLALVEQLLSLWRPSLRDKRKKKGGHADGDK